MSAEIALEEGSSIDKLTVARSENRFSYEFLAKAFDIQCVRLGDTPVFQITYTVELPVMDQIQHPQIPAGAWTFAILVSKRISSTSPPSSDKVTARIKPPAGISGVDKLDVDFFVSSPFFIRGKGGFQESNWQCAPIDISRESLMDLNIPNMLKRSDWKIDLIFHINTVSEATVASFDRFCGSLCTLLNTDTLTDCTLLSSDGKEFPAHRVILAAQSEVFAAMFQSDMAEKKTGRCEIKDLDSTTLGTLLDFMYRCKTSLINKDNVVSVFEAADKYAVLNLRDFCERVMVNNLAIENAVDYLSIANNRELLYLKKKAARFIGDHFGAI